MADITEPAAAPDGQGKNVAVEEGGATGAPAQAGKSFTQEQLDSIVRSRLAEERKRLDTKQTELLTAKLEEARQEFEKGLEKEVETRLTQREAAQRLEAARAALAEQLGLTESQAKRLNGDTPEELAADAKELFGKFVKVEDAQATARKTVQDQLGLTDKQMARLQGETPEELIADAKEVFGVEPKPAADPAQQPPPAPTPPVLRPGLPAGNVPAQSDLTTMSAAEVRGNWRKLLGN